MDNITAQLDQLSELNDEQISELQNSIVGEFDTVESADATPDTVDRMTSLADALDTVREEVGRREAQGAELATRAAEASARVKGAEPEVDAPAEDAAPAEDEDEDEEPVVASAVEEEASTEFAAEDAAVAATETVAELAVEEIAAVEAPAEAAELSVEEAPVVAEEATELSATDEVTEAPAEAEFAAETPIEEPTTPESELAVEAPAEAAVEVPVEAEASLNENPIEPQAQEEAPVTAAANEASFEAPADRRPVAQATAVPVAITAGADIPGYTAGSTISNMDEVGVAMEKRIHSLRRVNGGDGEQHIVASLTTHYPESRVLGPNAADNMALVNDVIGPEALIASGGFGAPLEANYDIFGFGTDVRPVRDSLPRFQAERGGVRHIVPPVLSSYANAIGVWTNAMDVTAASNNGTGDTKKNVLVVASASETTAYTDAITLQLQFGNLLTRAFPELITRHNELALIQHARIAELALLSKIGAASTAVTTTSVIGFGRDFLVQVKLAAAAYRSRHRLDPATQLRGIVPTWIYDALAADLTLNMPGDNNLGISRGDINGFLSSSNVTLTASLDANTFGAQSTGALLEFPDSFTWYLFSEGTFVFLDGGTLDIGLIRDSGLVGTNDYRMFTETFEGIGFFGIQSLAITSTIAVNGSASALRDTLGGVTAAAVEY